MNFAYISSVEYAYIRNQLSKPVDVVEPRRRRGQRETTKRVDSARSEPTAQDLTQVISGQLAGALVAQRFEVEGFLGRGGMATVYRAHDRTLGRDVALKVMHDSLTGDPQMLARFVTEAQLTAKIRSPFVVEVLDYGTTQAGVVYIAMELLEGEDLHVTLARRGSLPWRDVRRLMLGVCAGLQAVHRAGIVHRDLKPSNCFIAREHYGEHVKLLDFGVAQELTAVASGATCDVVVGTPEYMSPEQARGAAVDARSDIYSAGVLMCELLTGRRPFETDSVRKTMQAQIQRRAPSLRALAGEGAGEFPHAFERIVARALSKSPDNRHPDASSLEHELVHARALIGPPAFTRGTARPQAAFARRSPTLRYGADARNRDLGTPFAPAHEYV